MDHRTPDRIPVSPSLTPILPNSRAAIAQVGNARLLWLSGMSVGLGLAAAGVAEGLSALIGLITNLFFHGRLSVELTSPAGHALGLAVIAVPMAGGLVVGLMARFGSTAIRGHGIPEAMEQVLRNESRIPVRVMWLKPLSAAVAIGTGVRISAMVNR